MKKHESYYDYVERTSMSLNEMKNRLNDYEAEKKYNKDSLIDDILKFVEIQKEI